MILYLHGLNSSGASTKAARLREGLPGIEVISPTYPAHLAGRAAAQLEGLLGTLDPRRLVVVGSSLGGLYGQWLAGRYRFAHLVMINPALTPWELLPRFVGPQLDAATGEGYLLTAEMIEATRPYGLIPPDHRIPTTLFLDRGDEVIDYRIAERLYAGIGELRIFDGGDHAFAHMTEAIGRIAEIHRSVDG